MNRRNFLGTLIGGVAAAAAVRTWPFRVYSFPGDIGEPDLFDATRSYRSYWMSFMFMPPIPPELIRYMEAAQKYNNMLTDAVTRSIYG